MELISCDNCGVALDKKKLKFPEKICDKNGYIDDLCIWNGDGYIAIVPCPVCGGNILQDED